MSQGHNLLFHKKKATLMPQGHNKMTTSTALSKKIPSPRGSVAKTTPSTFGCWILPRSVAESCPSYRPRLIACITAPHLYGCDGGARARPRPPPGGGSTRRASGPAPARPAPAMCSHARPAPALRPHAARAPPAHQPARTRPPARPRQPVCTGPKE
jgi:hypothetical protein